MSQGTKSPELSLILVFSVLHPRHKLEYFKNAGWEAEWISTAEKIVRDEYERSYAGLSVRHDTGSEPDPAPEKPETGKVRRVLTFILIILLTMPHSLRICSTPSQLLLRRLVLNYDQS